jgi:hypothetical protein
MVVRCGANSAANCFNIRAGIWSGPNINNIKDKLQSLQIVFSYILLFL